MKIDFDEVKREAEGRWLGIFRSLGIEVREDGKHGKCPTCGGEDRMRLDRDSAERGTWFCNQCDPRSGDGVALVQNVLGVDFKGAMEAIADVVGICEKNVIPKEYVPKPEDLRKLFNGATKINERCGSWQYLKGRGLSSLPQNVWDHKQCYEGETKSKMEAMIAVFSLPCGEAVTVHRTYLDGTGEKANIESPKKMFPPLKPTAGGAIRLFEVSNVVAVAEGIETAIAVKELMNVPCWSVISTALMETFEPPKGIDTVIICADNDKNFAGQKSAYILANKLFNKGFNVSVMIPQFPGTDFLDELNSQTA